MADGIFLVSKNGGLVEMRQRPYETEAVLQELLANHPKILAGDLVDTDDPRRWLLVSREMGVPSEEGGGNKWSCDHLFLDQDGISTFVEVKRSTDTRIRREVVGQMLDYAANALAYWPVTQVREVFEKRCEVAEIDPQEVLEDHLQGSMTPADFWTNVGTNLEAGRVRLVFVADSIPRELQTIIEFLYRQLSPAEVIGIEVRHFADELGEHRTIVPRLVGVTATAAAKKAIVAGVVSAPVPILTNAAEAFQNTAGDGYSVFGRGARYRQVRIAGWPPLIHYEFVFTNKDGLSAELHIETDMYPRTSETLPRLKETLGEILGREVIYDAGWAKQRGRLRVVLGNEAAPEDATKVMWALIRGTEGAMARAFVN